MIIYRLQLLALLGLLAGCSTTYSVAPVSSYAINAAANQIDSFSLRDPKYVPINRAQEQLSSIYRKMYSSASFICSAINEREMDHCGSWKVTIVNSTELNAYASGQSEVFVNSGVLSHTLYESETALVLAHELSHHILNHINETRANIATGQALGALLSAALVSSVFSDSYKTCTNSRQGCGGLYELTEDIVETGGTLGSEYMRLTFSRAQEEEADLVAAYILAHSGYSLLRARELLKQMGKMDARGRLKSNFFDSHPVGPERLSKFDLVIDKVQNDLEGQLRIQ